MIGDAPKPNKNRQENLSAFQANQEGISRDFYNKTSSAFEYCSTLLEKPDYQLSCKPFSKEQLRKMVFEEIAKLSSYTVYMSGRKGLYDLLTPKGKEMVKRLDKIVTELKSLAVGDPQKLEESHITQIFNLLGEAKRIMYEK